MHKKEQEKQGEKRKKSNQESGAGQRRRKESAEKTRLRAASNKCVTGRSIISALVRRLYRLELCPIAHGKRKSTSHKNTRLILFRLFFQSGTPLVSCPKISSASSMAERARQAANKSFSFFAPPPKFRTSFCKMILVRYYRLFTGDRIKKMSACAFSPAPIKQPRVKIYAGL